jgi:hypothetical protein
MERALGRRESDQLISGCWHCHPGSKDGRPSEVDLRSWLGMLDLATEENRRAQPIHAALIYTARTTGPDTNHGRHPSPTRGLFTARASGLFVTGSRSGASLMLRRRREETRRAAGPGRGDLCPEPPALGSFGLRREGTRLPIHDPRVAANPEYFMGVVPLPIEEAKQK